MNPLLTESDLVSILKLKSARSIERLKKKPNFPLPFIMRPKRWRKEDIERWIAQGIRRPSRH